MQRREFHPERRSPGSAHRPRLELLVEITGRFGLGGIGEIDLFLDFQHVLGEFIVLVELRKVGGGFCRENFFVLFVLVALLRILGTSASASASTSVSSSSSNRAPAGAPMPNKAVSSSSS